MPKIKIRVSKKLSAAGLSVAALVLLAKATGRPVPVDDIRDIVMTYIGVQGLIDWKRAGKGGSDETGPSS